MKIANIKHGGVNVSGRRLRRMFKSFHTCPGFVFEDMPYMGEKGCLSRDEDWNEIADRCDECRYKHLKSDEEPDWEDCQ
jgi:hypothetical protein